MLEDERAAELGGEVVLPPRGQPHQPRLEIACDRRALVGGPRQRAVARQLRGREQRDRQGRARPETGTWRRGARQLEVARTQLLGLDDERGQRGPGVVRQLARLPHLGLGVALAHSIAVAAWHQSHVDGHVHGHVDRGRAGMQEPEGPDVEGTPCQVDPASGGDADSGHRATCGRGPRCPLSRLASGRRLRPRLGERTAARSPDSRPCPRGPPGNRPGGLGTAAPPARW